MGLSFLNSEAAFKRAEAARARFVKEHMRRVAHRRHEPLKYFKAHHHAAWAKRERAKFAKILKAKIAAHNRAAHAHNKARHAEARAKAHRRHAHRNVVSKAHHLR